MLCWVSAIPSKQGIFNKKGISCPSSVGGVAVGAF